jgi:hypothetical protein
MVADSTNSSALVLTLGEFEEPLDLFTDFLFGFFDSVVGVDLIGPQGGRAGYFGWSAETHVLSQHAG